MNKFGCLLILLSIAAFAACGDSSVQSANTSNSKISFGIYDIAKSEPSFSSPNKETLSKPILASNTGSGSGTGGGSGAGGGDQPAMTVVQNVSLSQTQASQNASVTLNRKIIRDAELGLESDSPEESQKKIAAIAESKGGFVVESQQSSSDARSNKRDSVLMIVRVPGDKFAEAIDEIRKTASRVIVETVKGQDVTEEFIDIEAQQKAKKALELQFMEIMKRANTVEDALNVQRQLSNVRGEIEKIEGRKRFLENQTSLSTIKVSIQTPAAISASSTGFGYRMTESLGNGLDIALNFILGLVTFVIAITPFTLFIGLPAFLAARYFWRRQNRPMTVSQIAEEEIKNA